MARAVRFDRYGGPDVLYLAEVDAPRPGLGEVVVAVQATAINPGETSLREGRLGQPITFPSGLGSDLAGVISQVGAGVTVFHPGDEVLGWTTRPASHADYVLVPADQLVRKPAALTWEVAGSLYVAGCTAYAAVRAVALCPGDTVVVSAAAGGVGSIAVQLAKLAGARVIGIASVSNHNWLRSMGVSPLAYGEGLLQRVRAAAAKGVDAFLDLHGGEYVRLALDLGVSPDRINTTVPSDAAKAYGVRTDGSSAASTTEVLAELVELASSGRLTVPIAATYPLRDVQKAFLDLSQGHTHGKIVLIP
jgi:NADPH2:quinone reductase